MMTHAFHLRDATDDGHLLDVLRVRDVVRHHLPIECRHRLTHSVLAALFLLGLFGLFGFVVGAVSQGAPAHFTHHSHAIRAT